MEHLKLLFQQFVTWCAGTVGSIIVAVLVWLIGRTFIKYMLKLLSSAFERGKLDAGIAKFSLSLAKFVGNVILVIMIIDILGFETTSFIAVLGSAGVAVGMSLQGSLSNFAGGILILMAKPFGVGDYIVTGGLEGTVTAIDLLYTKLMTIDNKSITIPNGTLSNSSVVNVGSEPVRRLDIRIGVSYDTDIKTAKQLLMDILDSHEMVRKDMEIRVIVAELGGSSVTLETRNWVDTKDYWDLKFQLLEEYKQTFDENGIEIPFEQLDVHLR